MSDEVTTQTPRFWKSRLLADLPWLIHGVTERQGGISEAPFTSLNLGLHVGDAAERVCQNRARVATSAGLSPEKMVCAEQVHDNKAALVTATDAGRGAVRFGDAISGVDALVTNESALLLTLFFADCLPILLADDAHQVVAVAHAGWRGLVGGVIENTLGLMTKQFGSRPESILAAIGPGIGRCCFEVGSEVAAHFPSSVQQEAASGKPHVDLPKAAQLRLEALGIPSNQIDGASICTACHTGRFFSHRREQGKTGRMGAFITKRG
jgi:YfiH family protein